MTRKKCNDCQRPLCLCHALPSQPFILAPSIQLIILQHPKETNRSHFSSIPLLQHCLCCNSCHVVVDDTFPYGKYKIIDESFYHANGRTLFVFPEKKSLLLESFICSASSSSCLPKQFYVIILDGTWKEVKKMFRYLQPSIDKQIDQGNMFQVYIEPNISSFYGDLRKEPKDGCVSSLEAFAYVLDGLDPVVYNPVTNSLRNAFKSMVELQSSFIPFKASSAPQPIPDSLSRQASVIHSSSNIEKDLIDKASLNVSGNHKQQYILTLQSCDARGISSFASETKSFFGTYDEAQEYCRDENRLRSRGKRFSVLPERKFNFLIEQKIKL